MDETQQISHALGNISALVSGSFASLIMIVCGLAAIYYHILLIIRAYRVHIAWAVAVIVVPLGNLLFAVTHWQVAKKPFLLSMVFLFI